MSRRYRKRRRHLFLKFILVMIIFLLAILAAGMYVRHYPGESAEKLKFRAKQAQQILQSGVSSIKEDISEKLDEQNEGSDKSFSARLQSTSDINLRSAGGGYYYFTYNGEDFKALYSYDTWTIYDSYRITNKKDMEIICQALSDERPVPSRDGQSYRTADDMAYEWDQHNKIHMIAPDGSRTKERTRNVDLDPEDQGKSYKDLYNENLGKN